MQTSFTRLAWNNVFRSFRRRGPTAPIRRRPPTTMRGLELVRLDDRVVPGNLLAASASEALLTGAASWLSLGDADRTATSPSAAPTRSVTEEAVDEPPPVESAFFTQMSADHDTNPRANPAVAEAGQSLQATTWGEFGESQTDTPAVDLPKFSGGSGTESAVWGSGAPVMVSRVESAAAGTSAVAGGAARSAPTATDSAGPARPAKAPPANGPAKTETAPRRPSTPFQPKTHTPAGRFGPRLQMLLHPDGTSGTFNLGDTWSQQSQIGALIGGQLFAGSMLGGDGNISHRGASLLGQALAAGSDAPIGLRTSSYSSGLFGLVGTHSIGDLLDGHGPSGGLDTGADLISQAIPASGSLPHPAAPVTGFGPAQESQSETTLSTVVRRPSVLPGDTGTPFTPVDEWFPDDPNAPDGPVLSSGGFDGG